MKTLLMLLFVTIAIIVLITGFACAIVYVFNFVEELNLEGLIEASARKKARKIKEKRK